MSMDAFKSSVVYSRYHTIIHVYTTTLLLTKPSSEDDSGFRHGFGAEVSLPLAQNAPAEPHDTTRLCQIVVALWDCHILADAVRALSWIFSMYFLLSDGGSPRLDKKTEVGLVMKPLHPISIGNTFVIQPFLTHCFRRSSYFSNLRWCTQSRFSSKGTVNSITKTFFALTDQMTISGRFVVNAISVGNMKLCFKSVATCHSMQPWSHDGLRMYIHVSTIISIEVGVVIGERIHAYIYVWVCIVI